MEYIKYNAFKILASYVEKYTINQHNAYGTLWVLSKIRYKNKRFKLRFDNQKTSIMVLNTLS